MRSLNSLAALVVAFGCSDGASSDEEDSGNSVGEESQSQEGSSRAGSSEIDVRMDGLDLSIQALDSESDDSSAGLAKYIEALPETLKSRGAAVVMTADDDATEDLKHRKLNRAPATTNGAKRTDMRSGALAVTALEASLDVRQVFLFGAANYGIAVAGEHVIEFNG